MRSIPGPTVHLSIWHVVLALAAVAAFFALARGQASPG